MAFIPDGFHSSWLSFQMALVPTWFSFHVPFYPNLSSKTGQSTHITPKKANAMLSRRCATATIRANWWDSGRLEHLVSFRLFCKHWLLPQMRFLLYTVSRPPSFQTALFSRPLSFQIRSPSRFALLPDSPSFSRFALLPDSPSFQVCLPSRFTFLPDSLSFHTRSLHRLVLFPDSLPPRMTLFQSALCRFTRMADWAVTLQHAHES